MNNSFITFIGVYVTLLLGCTSVETPVKSEFFTLDDSKLLSFHNNKHGSKDSIAGMYTIFDTLFEINLPFVSNSDKNALFFLRNSCLLRLNMQIHKVDTIFDFNMKPGDYYTVSEYNNLLNTSNNYKLLLHSKEKYHNDTLYSFEIRNMTIDTIFIEGYLTKFFIVSKINGIYGECLGSVDFNSKTIHYWYLNGLFNFSKFYTDFQIKKSRIL